MEYNPLGTFGTDDIDNASVVEGSWRLFFTSSGTLILTEELDLPSSQSCLLSPKFSTKKYLFTDKFPSKKRPDLHASEQVNGLDRPN